MQQNLLNGGVKSEKDNWIVWDLVQRENGDVEIRWARKVVDDTELSVKEILTIYPSAQLYKEHDIHIVG